MIDFSLEVIIDNFSKSECMGPNYVGSFGDELLALRGEGSGGSDFVAVFPAVLFFENILKKYAVEMNIVKVANRAGEVDQGLHFVVEVHVQKDFLLVSMDKIGFSLVLYVGEISLQTSQVSCGNFLLALQRLDSFKEGSHFFI
jgi:hypothetical protein